MFGHVRSVSTTGINGEYFSNCIFLGCVGFGAMVLSFVVMKKPPDLFRFRGFGGSGYEAVAVM